MDQINWAIVGAAFIHIIEEYVYPGGFTRFLMGINREFATRIDNAFIVVVNGLFVLLCIANAFLAEKFPVFNLSVAGLLGFNALMHLGGAVRARRYAPGMISGLLLYLPLFIIAYTRSIRSNQVTPVEATLSILLGITYNAIPLVYLALSRTRRNSINGHTE